MRQLTSEQYAALGGRLRGFLRRKGIRYFQILVGRHGGMPLAVRLNMARKGRPAHAIHFHEGMQIRNWLRGQPECRDWTDHDFDDLWIPITLHAIDRPPPLGQSGIAPNPAIRAPMGRTVDHAPGSGQKNRPRSY